MPDMKLFSDFGRFIRERPKANLVCLVLFLAVTAGCGKSSDSAAVAPPPVPSSSDVTPPPAPAPQAMQAVVVTNTDDQTKQMQSLNRALVGWMIRNHRHPQTFQEFASTAGFSIPNPPAGKKYTLNARGFIVLADAN